MAGDRNEPVGGGIEYPTEAAARDGWFEGAFGGFNRCECECGKVVEGRLDVVKTIMPGSPTHQC